MLSSDEMKVPILGRKQGQSVLPKQGQKHAGGLITRAITNLFLRQHPEQILNNRVLLGRSSALAKRKPSLRTASTVRPNKGRGPKYDGAKPGQKRSP